jgi:hypothetical protein
LYHLTDVRNLARIRLLRRLESAELLLRKAGQSAQLDQRRPVHLTIMVGGMQVILRDQDPLHAGNIEIDAGWTFDAVIALLNQRVFFWPGRPTGPNDYGLRHYKRYEAEQPAIIRVPTTSMLHANPDNQPLFCRYNSGSPR